jgi:hypothetical protein
MVRFWHPKRGLDKPALGVSVGKMEGRGFVFDGENFLGLSEHVFFLLGETWLDIVLVRDVLCLFYEVEFELLLFEIFGLEFLDLTLAEGGELFCFLLAFVEVFGLGFDLFLLGDLVV